MAALPSISDTIDYADLAIGYCANDNAKGVLFGKRLTAPSSPVTQAIVTDALRWAYQGGAVAATTLREMANYLWWLINPYGLTAQAVISGGGGGGTVVPGTGTGYGYYVITDTISSQGATYQNNDLILGTQLGYVILNDQTFSVGTDFTFDNTTGTITLLTMTLFSGDKIIIPFNKKL